MHLNICQQMLKVASAALGQWPCISIVACQAHTVLVYIRLNGKRGEEERKCSALVY